jgi:hypothetical protein
MGLPEPTASASSAFGRAIHQVVEYHFNELLAGNEPPTLASTMIGHLGVAIVIGCLYVNHREWLKRPLSAHSLFKSQLKHCIVERRETYFRKSIGGRDVDSP